MSDTEARFERHGGPPDLPAVFSAFVLKALGGRSLDERFNIESSEGKFPDFGIYRDLVLIEMKHLEADQRERIQAVLDKKIPKDERPVFYGQRTVNIDNASFSNGDEIRRAILTKLNRSLEGHFRKANRQLRNYRLQHPRKNALNVCAILNSRVAEFTPEIVASAINSKMLSTGGQDRFEAIDAVLYFSEKHFTPTSDGRAAYPVMVHECTGLIEHGWKADLLDKIIHSWALYRTGIALQSTEETKAFTSVEDIPELMTQSSAWQLEYDRKPYLQELTLAELRVAFNRNVAVNSQSMLIGNWPKPPPESIEDGFRRFQHLNAEVNRRGIDLREMSQKKLSQDEWKLVFEGLPIELAETLKLHAKK